MALINIDDRDITHITTIGDEVIIKDILPEPIVTPNVLSKFTVIRSLLKSEFPASNVEHLGKGFFKLDFPATVNTGSDITTYFTIPVMHKMHRVEFKHTDSSYADSTNALTYSLKYGSTHNPALLFALIAKSGSTASDVAHMLDNFWRATSRYQLTMNTTNTELVYVSLLFEVEDDPLRG